MNRLKLLQPPYSIFGFWSSFCLLQSKQTFVKSSHLLGLFTLCAFDKKKRTVFIKIFETNMQGRSNTKNFAKVLPIQGAAITVLHWNLNKLPNIYLVEKIKKLFHVQK